MSACLVCYCRESARALCLCAKASGVYGFNLTAGISTEYASGPHFTSGHISAENAAKSHSHKKNELSFKLSHLMKNNSIYWWPNCRMTVHSSSN